MADDPERYHLGYNLVPAMVRFSSCAPSTKKIPDFPAQPPPSICDTSRSTSVCYLWIVFASTLRRSVGLP